MNSYRIDRAYSMKTDVTDRTLQVAEAFGVSLDNEYTFTVYDNVSLDIKPGSIVLIMGDSGSGKSTLLKELRDNMPNAVMDSELSFDKDIPIIDAVGNNISAAYTLLNTAGLSDTFLYLRRYNELSEGQKYRFRLAKMLESNFDTYFIDEYCALLDRDTAKVVSYSLQKAIKKSGKTLIVATSHSDLAEDLNPDIVIYKGLEANIDICYKRATPKECSIVKDISISLGTAADYKALARFHYRAQGVNAVQKYFKMTYKGEVIGVILYAYTYLALAGRNAYTNRYKKATSEVARLINEEIALISRVIIHPKYRGIGLGAKLIKDTMHLTGKRIVEMLTTMGEVNPFAEKAGMRRIEYTPYDPYKGVRKELTKLGFDLQFVNSPSYNLEKLTEIDKADYERLAHKVILTVGHTKAGINRGQNNPFKIGNIDVSSYGMADIARMIREVNPHKKAYYIWENPSYQVAA